MQKGSVHPTAVIEDHPEITSWTVGGHSLGGSMAAQYIDSHPGAIDGLVLWASYSAADLGVLLGAGIDVICNPQPGGNFWGVRGGASQGLISRQASGTERPAQPFTAVQ